ncbi:MAG: hypothetical protein LBI69_05250 [Puniceicoccales bacterium]|jgi:hypothetical protein|nr:hypothetical protein [Puniceicoccales bacterium]
MRRFKTKSAAHSTNSANFHRMPAVGAPTHALAVPVRIPRTGTAKAFS